MQKLDDSVMNALIQVQDNKSTHRTRLLYKGAGTIGSLIGLLISIPFGYVCLKKWKKRYTELWWGLYRQRQEDLDKVEETPSIQVFELGNDTILSIHHYEWCPELTAFIQVLTDTEKTKLYKRKVQCKGYQKFITFQGRKYLLDENKIVIAKKEDLL